MGFAIADMFMKKPDYAGQAVSQNEQRQQNIQFGTNKINQAYSGFNPAFYKQRQQDYINYAMPQLSQQYTQNKNQVGFGLANKGLLGGSSANQQFGKLNVANAQAQQGISDAGIAQAQSLQQQVAQSKNQLLGNLYQTADPAGAGSQAIGTAASFGQPSVFQPLANQFQNFANTYYLSQLINAYKPLQGGAYGGGTPQQPYGNPQALPQPTTTTGY